MSYHRTGIIDYVIGLACLINGVSLSFSWGMLIGPLFSFFLTMLGFYLRHLIAEHFQRKAAAIEKIERLAALEAKVNQLTKDPQGGRPS